MKKKLKKLYKLTLILFFQIIFVNSVFSQTIKGIVIDSLNNPIPFVNVIVLNKNDSSFIDGNNFPDGKFIISEINKKDFIVRIALLGYVDNYISVKANIKDTINLGKIKLQQKNYQINEVVVSEKIPLMKVNNGNLTINVNSTPLKNEESVADILKNAPGVITSINGGIEVFGKGKPLILINGKKISSESQLQMLKPSEIKNIEILQNSMSKYDASYKSIINIITNTKNISLGGQLYNKLQYSELWVNNTTVSLNQNNNKLSQYLSYSYTTGKINSFENSKNSINTPSGLYMSSFDSKTIDANKTHDLFYACDYKLNKLNNIGVQWAGNFNNSVSNSDLLSSINSYTNYDIQNKINQKNNKINNSIDLNYTYAPDSTSQLMVIADYSQYRDKNNMTNNELVQEKESLLSNLGKINYNIYSFQADYSRLIGRKSILMSFGLKYSSVKNNNDNIFTTFKDSITYNDSIFNNNSLQHEEIGAAYLTLSKEIKKIKLSTGIRTEYNKRSLQINNINNTLSPQVYLFPTFSVNYNVNDSLNLSLTYTKSINRAGFQATSQEFIYVNPVLYIQGNPYLKNTISNNLSLTILAMQFIYLELNYSEENNYSAMGFFNNDSIVIAKYINYNRQKLYASLSANVRNDRLSTNFGINISKLLSSYVYLNEKQTPQKIGLTLSTTNIITIKDGLEFYFSAQYNSPIEEDFYRFKSSYSTDLGLRKYFLKKSLRIAIYAKINPSERYEVQYNNVSISHKYLKNTYMIYLTALYKFNFKNWEKYYSSQSEEKGRM